MKSKSFVIECDGVKLQAKLDFPKEEKEKYPLLIILHGFTGYMEERHIIATAQAACESGYAALRVDQYGHGTSEGKFYDHTVLIWMTHAMRIIEYARKLDFVSDIILSGHSQGGLNTVLAGGMMEDRLKALMPMSPAMVIPDTVKKGEFLGVPFDNDHLPEEITMSDGRKLSSNYIRAARMLPVEEAIKRFKKPVCIIHGTADEAVPYHYGKNLAAAYDNAELVTIEGDDHCYNYHLDQVTEAVKAFLLKMLPPQEM